MRNLRIILISLSISYTAHADDLYYYSRYPEIKLLNDKAILCDLYVRQNSDTFKKDMHNLLKAYPVKDWDKSKNILSKFNIDTNANNMLKNTFISSVIDCGNNYEFSDGVNYYRELFKSAPLFLMNINNSIKYPNSFPRDIDEHYKTSIQNLDKILNSENKNR